MRRRAARSTSAPPLMPNPNPDPCKAGTYVVGAVVGEAARGQVHQRAPPLMPNPNPDPCKAGTYVVGAAVGEAARGQVHQRAPPLMPNPNPNSCKASHNGSNRSW